MKHRKIVFDQHGAPAEVCRCSEQAELSSLNPGDVQVRMLLAPINPADLNMIQGTYAYRPPLPAVPGGEGIGIVEEPGSGVSDLRPGDTVVVAAGVGTWRERLVAPATSLFPVPGDIQQEQGAMLRVNPPTAYRMLHDFVRLGAGEWFIQNAANSGVGRSAIQIAKALGWRSVNIVRRAELVDELKAIGADEVLVEGEDLPERIAAVTQSAEIRLALNAVGGESAMRLAEALAPGGIHVTYGAMARQPLRMPTGMLIFKDLSFRGFWVTRWYRESPRAEQIQMLDELVRLVRGGLLQTPVEKVFPLEQIGEALQRASAGGRAGKILLRCSDGSF